MTPTSGTQETWPSGLRQEHVAGSTPSVSSAQTRVHASVVSAVGGAGSGEAGSVVGGGALLVAAALLVAVAPPVGSPPGRFAAATQSPRSPFCGPLKGPLTIPAQSVIGRADRDERRAVGDRDPQTERAPGRLPDDRRAVTGRVDEGAVVDRAVVAEGEVQRADDLSCPPLLTAGADREGRPKGVSTGGAITRLTGEARRAHPVPTQRREEESAETAATGAAQRLASGHPFRDGPREQVEALWFRVVSSWSQASALGGPRQPHRS
jgi:hypothetical protein